jgi:hypothetical protein
MKEENKTSHLPFIQSAEDTVWLPGVHITSLLPTGFVQVFPLCHAAYENLETLNLFPFPAFGLTSFEGTWQIHCSLQQLAPKCKLELIGSSHSSGHCSLVECLEETRSCLPASGPGSQIPS